MATMKAAVMEELRKPLVITECPMPEIGPGEVLVQTRACGICGTDLHIRNGYAYVPDLPHILGHEAAGVVAQVGEDVANLAVGQRVVAYNFVTCGHCYYCRVGRDTQCTDLQGLFGISLNGGFAEYFKLPATNLFVLPDNVPFTAGGLIADALLTAVHAMRRTRLQLDDTAVVWGAGGVGQCLIQLLHAAGIRIIAVSRSAGKLELAQKLGAERALRPDDPDTLEQIKAISGGDGAQCVFDCVGSGATMKASAASVMRGGQIVVIGEEPEFPEIDTIQIAQRELEIIGTRNGTKRDMIDAIGMVARGIVTLQIAQTFPLDAINDAFELVTSGQMPARVVIEVSK